MAATVVAELVGLRERFRIVRQRSIRLCSPLTPEDMMVQSCPEASPAKWHLAHTAWFFESFLLKEFLPGYRLFNTDFPWLFNSYYQTFAEFPDKRLRASFSRPALDEVLRYREHVDEGIERLLESGLHEDAQRQVAAILILGLNHEEQHQELLLTDIKHALYTNPLQPAYLGKDLEAKEAEAAPLEFFSYEGGLMEIGQNETDSANPGGFGFDNERPRHRVWLEPFKIASRLTTCREFAEFIEDGGYSRPELWLSAGWQTVQDEGWQAPLYWRRRGANRNSDRDSVEEEWAIGGLRGKRLLSEVEACPVTHVSFFEADAYARWKGLRLATEAEWESVAATVPVEGNLLESGRLEPVAIQSGRSFDEPAQLFGDCWEWTSSAYLGYPGFVPLAGSLGEYNGKFMSGQMVLRGGSCVTPAKHIRASYRNFFPPETRWQFSGIRLASS